MHRKTLLLAAAGAALVSAGAARADAPAITGSVSSMLDGTNGSVSVTAPSPPAVALVRQGQVVQSAPAGSSGTTTLALRDGAVIAPGDVVHVTDAAGATLDDFTVPAHPVAGCGNRAATGTLPGDGSVTVKRGSTAVGSAEVKAGKPFSAALTSGTVDKQTKLAATFTVTGKANGYDTSFEVDDVQRICPVSTDFYVKHPSFDSAHGRFTLPCHSAFAGGKGQVLASSVIGGRRRTVARARKKTVKGTVTFHVKLNATGRHALFHNHVLVVQADVTAHRAGDRSGVHHTYTFTLHHS